MEKLLVYIALILLLSHATDASAYIGPGLGTGALVAVLGALVGLCLLIVGIIWYPVKKLIRRMRTKKQ